MKITVLSGKGGTGKTTVSTNLAYNIDNTHLYDTDVEEPNSHLFYKPVENNLKIEKALKSVPVINNEFCTLCGKCSNFCRYNALLTAKTKVLVFEESCHDCGGCAHVCPHGAISYKDIEIGQIITGKTQYQKPITYGLLNVGELSGVKIIEDIKDTISPDVINIFDAPPGTSCATHASVEDSDYAVLVTEPTPFGVSDMKMVVEMLRNMKIPFGVVVNKAGLGDDEIYEYCEEEGLEIIMEIPYSRNIAKLYATGDIFSKNMPEYQEKFQKLFEIITTNMRSNSKNI